MIAVAIPFASTSPSPLLTTSHQCPIDGTRPHPQHGAGIGVCIGVRAVRCCFSGADGRSSGCIRGFDINIATMTFSTVAVDNGINDNDNNNNNDQAVAIGVDGPIIVLSKLTTTIPTAAADATGGG